jgi:hypothetical protein
MTKTKLVEGAEQFFDDKGYAALINLTKEEVEIFSNFLFEVLNDAGLRQASGSYSNIIIYDVEEEYEADEEVELLVCEVEVGEQDIGQGYSSSQKWDVRFNRKTKKFRGIHEF